jgi:hypothetical protein
MSVVGDMFWTRQRKLAFWYRFTWKLRRGAAKTGRRLILAAGAADGARIKGVPAVVPYYGDHRLLNWFLAYYRGLGAGHFVFLDLGAKRDLHEWVGDAADCSVWRPEGFMHPSSTIHALNFLRHRYARGKWCLSVEPFDLLVFPKSETRHLRDLIDFVESEQRDHVAAVVVDAYGDGPAREMAVTGERSPVELLPYFDRFGYQTMEAGETKAVPIMGGVQRRALYGDEPKMAPPLNRIPLVKISKEAFYTASTRQLVPHKLNTPHSDWHSTTTACLLRYAMLGDEVSLHIAKQAEGGQLYPDQTTAMYPGSETMAGMTLKNQNSGRFTGSQDLLGCGLINNGQWF